MQGRDSAGNWILVRFLSGHREGRTSNPRGRRDQSTLGQNQVVLSHLIIHFPTSKQTNECCRAQQAVWSKKMSERCKQMNKWARKWPILTYRFMAVLTHSTEAQTNTHSPSSPLRGGSDQRFFFFQIHSCISTKGCVGAVGPLVCPSHMSNNQ